MYRLKYPLEIHSISQAFLVSDNNNTKEMESGIDNKGYDGYSDNNSEKAACETGTNLFKFF